MKNLIMMAAATMLLAACGDDKYTPKVSPYAGTWTVNGKFCDSADLTATCAAGPLPVGCAGVARFNDTIIDQFGRYVVIGGNTYVMDMSSSDGYIGAGAYGFKMRVESSLTTAIVSFAPFCHVQFDKR